MSALPSSHWWPWATALEFDFPSQNLPFKAVVTVFVVAGDKYTDSSYGKAIVFVSFSLSLLHSAANSLPPLLGEIEDQKALCVLQEKELVFG